MNPRPTVRRPMPIAMLIGPRHVPHGRSAPATGEVHAALNTVQAGHDGSLVPVRGGKQHARADEFELESRRGGATHLRQAFVDEIGGTAQLGGAENARLGLHPFHHVDRGVDEPLLRGVRHGGQDHQVPQPLQQVGNEPPGIVTALDDPVHDLEGHGAVPRGEGLDNRIEQRRVRVPEQRGGHGVCHTGVARPREQLVHDGHGVTHGPGTGPYDQRQHPVLDGNALMPADLAQVLPEGSRRHEPERVVVGTRPDRPDDLLGFGGGEDELQMLGRLFDDLQQRVEAGRRDHVGLVDDVDLVPTAGGPEESLLSQVTGVVDTTVGRGVDLDDVDRTRPVPGQVPARLALSARGRRRPLLAVEAAGQNPRAGGLPAPARAAEQVRVIDPVVPQRLLQRVGYMLLPDDLGERLRAITAVQRERRHAYEVIGAH